MARRWLVDYTHHEQLLTRVRPHAEIWRLLTGLAIIAAVYTVLNLFLFGLLASAASDRMVANLQAGSSPAALLILLGSFGFVTIGVAFAVQQMQRRNLGSVIGPWPLAAAQFGRVLWVLLVLGIVVFVLPPYGFDASLEPNLPLARWVVLLPLSLLAVLIQTSAEEILFRGYLQQSLAARFSSPLIWMGVPSLLFAAGHYAPAVAGDNAVLVAIWALVFGLLSADLTARAGTLGPAIAMHFVNNTVALLIISLPDSLSGLALYHLPYDMSDTRALRPWLMVDFAVMIVSWLAVRLALRR